MRATLILFLLAPRLFSAGVIIGSESALTVPTSAYYSSVINVRPGNGETVTNNPPIFSWFYNTNHLAGGEMNPNGFTDTIWMWTNSFKLQVASNAAFTGTLLVDVTTFHNQYNFIAPLSTNHGLQFWWRAIYQRTDTPYWTNAYTFTLAGGSTNWDRSLFASTNYLATNGNAHPLLCFRAGEEAGIYAYLQTQADFVALTNTATAATNKAYWVNVTEWGTNSNYNINSTTFSPSDVFTRVTDVGSVLLLWAISGDIRWTNDSMTGWLLTNVDHYATWASHPSNNMSIADSGATTIPPDAPLLLAAGYDWMWNYMGSDTSVKKGRVRTNLLSAIAQCMRIQNWANAFYTDTNTGGYSYFAAGQYPYPTSQGSVPAHSTMKIPSSHPHLTFYTFFPLALVSHQDSADSKMVFDWGVNHFLARGSGYSGFAAYHAGPYGYAYAGLAKIYSGGVIAAMMHIDHSYPQLQIYRNDFCRSFPDWMTRMIPFNMRRFHGPYGDGGPYTEDGHAGSFGFRAMGWDLAAVARSGAALQLYNLNAAYHEPGGAYWIEMPLRWHYTNTPALVTNSTSKVFIEDGYVIASSVSSSEFGSYTNGVGFSMRARPRGSLLGHDVFTDGSMDIWAYGTQLTDGGGANCCGEEYNYNPESGPGMMFVGGYSQNAPGYLSSPRIPVQASISAFTNSGTDFVYAAAELTGLFTNGWAHPLSNIVTKARQHILFPRSKYFVIYTEFGSTVATNFQWRWHIPWVWRWPGSGSPLANEIEVNTGQFGSNSFARTTNGFTYEAGNFALTTYTSPPRLPVHVVFANNTNQFGVFAATGVGSLGTTADSVNGTSSTNSTLNPFRDGGKIWSAGGVVDRAAGIWVTNRTPATNFTLMTVIVPQQTGVAAPTILRLDDNTVAVTYDGVTETNTFGTGYTGAYTYQIAVAGQSANQGSVASPVRLIISGSTTINGGTRGLQLQ